VAGEVRLGLPRYPSHTIEHAVSALRSSRNVQSVVRLEPSKAEAQFQRLPLTRQAGRGWHRRQRYRQEGSGPAVGSSRITRVPSRLKINSKACQTAASSLG
jgi:hypothetical protein